MNLKRERPLAMFCTSRVPPRSFLHTMTQKSQTPIMVTRYRRIDMHCGKLSHSATTNKA